MSKSPRKRLPDVGIELGAACMPSEHASDRATAPGFPTTDNLTVSRFPSLNIVFLVSQTIRNTDPEMDMDQVDIASRPRW